MMSLKSWVQSDLESGFTLKVQKASSVDWTPEITARKMETVLEGPNGGAALVVYYVHSGMRGYVIYLLGGEKLADYKEEIGQVLSSIQLFPPQLYGVPHEETLTLLGAPLVEKSLDPALTTSSSEGYVGLLFSGLVRLDSDLQVVPELAESWSVSPDGLEYTFTLRPNLKFSSGTTITAQDVKDSWERACKPATKSTTASTYLGDIVGVKEMLAGSAKEISGVKVVDERTLKVTLDRPKPYFLAKLTYPTSYVVDGQQTYSYPLSWINNPHSSGPYQIKEYIENEAFLFERNPAYWAPASIPYVLYLIYPGGSPISLYREGTIDLVYPPLDELKEIKKIDNPLNLELLETASMCTSMMIMNANQAPLDDPLVRKALWQATDRNELNEKLTGSTGILDNSILPPAMPGYQAVRSLPEYDPAAAQATFAQSKYAGQPVQLTLTVSGYPGDQNLAIDMMTDMWQQTLGITVKVEYVDPADFSGAAVRKDGMQMVSYGWCADYPDPENFLDVLFHSASDMNVGHVNHPEVDALLEKARAEQDPIQRLVDYQQAESILLENFDVIPWDHAVSTILVKPRVKGYRLLPLSVPQISGLSLEN